MDSQKRDIIGPDEQILYVARIMNFRVKKDGKKFHGWVRETDEGGGWRSWEAWNPRVDWNHWRQVEEKAMEDRDLFQRALMSMSGENIATRFYNWIEADLPTRVSALIASHQSLHP